MKIILPRKEVSTEPGAVHAAWGSVACAIAAVPKVRYGRAGPRCRCCSSVAFAWCVVSRTMMRLFVCAPTGLALSVHGRGCLAVSPAPFPVPLRFLGQSAHRPGQS
jgi:hypothetical protein